MAKIRVNLANPAELCEIPGIRATEAEAIVRFRAEHGPIANAEQLAAIMGAPSLDPAVRDRLDFDPAGVTAPESPGA
jgi:competence ComEA-like helix-hairpin-helix protein